MNKAEKLFVVTLLVIVTISSFCIGFFGLPVSVSEENYFLAWKDSGFTVINETTRIFVDYRFEQKIVEVTREVFRDLSTTTAFQWAVSRGRTIKLTGGTWRFDDGVINGTKPPVEEEPRRIDGEIIEGEKLQEKYVIRSLVDGTKANKTVFVDSRILDSICDGCNFDNCFSAYNLVKNGLMSNSQIDNNKLSQCYLKNCALTQSVVYYGVIYNSTIEDSKLTDCILHDCVLSNSTRYNCMIYENGELVVMSYTDGELIK